MTQRSVLTTQSKLTAQTPVFWERDARQMRQSTLQGMRNESQCGDKLVRLSSWRSGGSARPCALSRIVGRSLERKFANLFT